MTRDTVGTSCFWGQLIYFQYWGWNPGCLTTEPHLMNDTRALKVTVAVINDGVSVFSKVHRTPSCTEDNALLTQPSPWPPSLGANILLPILPLY